MRPTSTIHVGDCIDVLRSLPETSVHCVVTSPPYWGLRDYGTGTWTGGDAACDHCVDRFSTPVSNKQASNHGSGSKQERGTCRKCGAVREDKQLGSEPTPEAFVEKMVEVFREVRRVMRDDGTLWLNLGGGYIDKQLDGLPWRVALALQADGWVLRSDIIWGKANPMPESVTDRPTKSHEHVFLFSKAKWTGPAGTMPTAGLQSDFQWAAAMIDAEGSICVNRKMPPQSRLVHPTYASRVCCYNTHRPIVERVAAIAGFGKLSERTDGRNRPVYQWQAAGPRVVPFIVAIEPFLMAKKSQAAVALELQLSNGGHGNRPGFGNGAKEKTASVRTRQAELYRACSELNKLGETGIRIKPWTAKWTAQPYSYDAEAVKEASSGRELWFGDCGYSAKSGRNDGSGIEAKPGTGTRNLRDVWTIPTESFKEAHFATYPRRLVEPCIKAGTSDKGCCPACGAPWVRVVEHTAMVIDRSRRAEQLGKYGKTQASGTMVRPSASATTGWRPSCTCDAGAPVPCTVLDPFSGAGTTGVVAKQLGRNYVGIELNPEYAEMSRRRIANPEPMTPVADVEGQEFLFNLERATA